MEEGGFEWRGVGWGWGGVGGELNAHLEKMRMVVVEQMYIAAPRVGCRAGGLFRGGGLFRAGVHSFPPRWRCVEERLGGDGRADVVGHICGGQSPPGPLRKETTIETTMRVNHPMVFA